MPHPQLTVVVPCFDESEVIDAFHAALVAALQPTGERFEICYVDDGSDDGTAERLRALAAASPHTCATRPSAATSARRPPSSPGCGWPGARPWC
ncbi:glycosyltransferase [Streptomyces sp. PmtA]|uniref:glycosyltransferase n=1 Tax=Streptomyces sp. PmtA TaxID=3074275 RepID=UPI003FCCE8AD